MVTADYIYPIPDNFFNVSAVEANEVFDFRGVRLDWFRLQVKTLTVTCVLMQVWLGDKPLKYMLLIVQAFSVMLL